MKEKVSEAEVKVKGYLAKVGIVGRATIDKLRLSDAMGSFSYTNFSLLGFQFIC